MMVLFPDGCQMLETEDGDDFDSDDKGRTRKIFTGLFGNFSKLGPGRPSAGGPR